jgi:hypothetical protein
MKPVEMLRVLCWHLILSDMPCTPTVLFSRNMIEPVSRKPWFWVLAMLICSCVAAQEPPAKPNEHNWHGAWMATAGPAHSFRGRWWANLLPATHNAANGSWTLLSDTNQILLEGTWSARKSSRGWQGTWSARVGQGQTFSGTWECDAPDLDDKTFEDLLKRTMEKQVSGSWQRGRMQGGWWLQGPG